MKHSINGDNMREGPYHCQETQDLISALSLPIGDLSTVPFFLCALLSPSVI
jgi:hypothetical protein